MVMLMQLWRLECASDGISLDNLCLFLTKKDISLLVRGKLYYKLCAYAVDHRKWRKMLHNSHKDRI